MCRSKPGHHSSEQGNQQQTPGAMLAGNDQGSPAGLLHDTDTFI
jgi:hypothetical protein